MRRIIPILLAVITLLAAGFGVLHHLRGARFQISVSPRSPVTVSDCQAQLQRIGYGTELDQRCTEGQDRPWFHAIVRNTGHRAAWVSTCTATGWDGSGHALAELDPFDVPMWMSSPGIGARPYLEPGQSESLDWFAPTKAAVDHYTASCSLIVYSIPPT